MGTILAAAVISRAQIIIQDATGTRWPEPELLDWLNDGQREVVLFKPNACVKNKSVPLVAGTKQVIPSDGIALVAVRRNMGVNGTTPGEVITLIDRRIMDDQRRGWHVDDPDTTVVHYMFEQDDQKHFYVYPPQPATPHQVELVFSAAPDSVTAEQALSIDDIYANALVDYIVYRAFSKDVDYAANDGRADLHYRRFASALGIKLQNEGRTRPTTRPDEGG